MPEMRCRESRGKSGCPAGHILRVLIRVFSGGRQERNEKERRARRPPFCRIILLKKASPAEIPRLVYSCK
jgi:hypothetical protein